MSALPFSVLFLGSCSFIRCSDSLLVPLTDERGHALATYNQHQSVYNIRNCIFVLFFSFRHSVCALTCFTFVKTTGIFCLLSRCISLTPERGMEKLKEFVWRHYPTMCSAGSYIPPPPLNSVDVWNVYRKRQKTVEKRSNAKNNHHPTLGS